MMIQTLQPILAEHPFAKDLDPRYLNILVGCAKNVRFEAGEFLFREGDEADYFYLIRQGVAAVELHIPSAGQINVATVGEGEVLGWSWLFPPYRWKFDARAVESTRAIALDGKCLRVKCEADHDLGYELLKRFAYLVEQRLDATRLQLLDVYGAHA